MERLIKRKPRHIHEEYPEHNWCCEEDGTINEFAMEYEYHNGPSCKRCGYSFCVHCDPDGWNKKLPCIIDEDYCPNCGRMVHNMYTYCPDCGQALDWEELCE